MYTKDENGKKVVSIYSIDLIFNIYVMVELKLKRLKLLVIPNQ